MGKMPMPPLMVSMRALAGLATAEKGTRLPHDYSHDTFDGLDFGGGGFE